MVLFTYLALVSEDSSHIYASEHNVTLSPADDIIHVRGHSCPEAVFPWVARLRLHVRLFALAALVEPPKLPTAEQVAFAVVGPDEGCLHPVHQHPAFSLHAPFGERPRVTGHGHCVLENPILRSLTDGGKCERELVYVRFRNTFTNGSQTVVHWFNKIIEYRLIVDVCFNFIHFCKCAEAKELALNLYLALFPVLTSGRKQQPTMITFWHQTHCSLQTVCGLWPYKTLLQYWKTPEPPSTILDEFTYLEPSALKEPALLCRTNLRILFKFGITSLLFRRKST